MHICERVQGFLECFDLFTCYFLWTPCSRVRQEKQVSSEAWDADRSGVWPVIKVYEQLTDECDYSRQHSANSYVPHSLQSLQQSTLSRLHHITSAWVSLFFIYRVCLITCKLNKLKKLNHCFNIVQNDNNSHIKVLYTVS